MDDLLSGSQDIALGPLQQDLQDLQNQADNGQFRVSCVHIETLLIVVSTKVYSKSAMKWRVYIHVKCDKNL